MGLFKSTKSRKRQPPIVPTDKVVPLGWFDDTLFTRNAVFQTAFLYDDVLDASKLRDSMERLINRDGWQKLGSRLRRNPITSDLDLHIPVEFNSHRPAIRFHHMTHDMSRLDHPIAANLPRPTLEPAVMSSPHDFEELWKVKGVPKKIKDYLVGDEPILTLIVVSFDDATIVCLTWPHFLCDAVGLGIILESWSLELQRRGDEIPRPIGIDYDPLAEVGKRTTEPHTLDDSRLSTVGFFVWSLRHLPELLLKSQQQNRTVCVPAAYMRKMKEQALSEAPADLFDGTDKPRLTDGDVLSAWWAQVNSAYLGKKRPGRLVSLINGLGWRFTDGVLPDEGPYLGNAVGMCVTTMTSAELAGDPMGEVAARVRRGIADSRRTEQVEAYAALWRQVPARMNPIFGSKTMHLVTVSNWSRARILDLDLSAAVVANVRDSRFVRTGSGRPSYTQSCFSGIVFPNFAIVHGKDTQGNYWISNVTTGKHWKSIRDAIEAKARNSPV